MNRHGSVFILRGDLISAEDRILLQTAARAVLLSRRGTLAEQVVRQPRSEAAWFHCARRLPATKSLDVLPPRPDLEFFNGLGGFAADGREYVTILGEGQWTPAPWINVIANPAFGFQVSESGSGYTWSLNSRENQLTPWSNDPVSDPPGETIYVRDEDSGELWGPTVLPIREEAWPYIARHGQGYSRFEHASHGVSLDLLQFVPLEDPIKISRLTIENHSGRSETSLGDGVCRVGARRFAERLRALRRHRDRRRNGSDVRAQRLEQRVRWSRGLCRPRRAPDRVDG